MTNNTLLDKKYVLDQITNLYLIASGSEFLSKEYLKEKFDLMLSGEGINIHEKAKDIKKTYKLKLIKNDK